MDPKQSLSVLSRIWGKRSGYVFLPWIDGNCKNKDERRKSYHEGRAYYWPRDKAAILEHMEAHTNDDLYFCPNLFDMKRRISNFAREERALWADLDEVDPREIDSDLQPTIAWESSPGHYQAIWLLTADALLASEPGGLGQRLTYHLGADLGGWDATQLLRPPGWHNHKPEYREKYGSPPRGKVLWRAGPRYDPAELHEELPELTTAFSKSEAALEQDIASVNIHEVMGRVRSKLPREAKDLIRAKDDGGADRSAKLFYIEQCLAEAGCTLTEIVALVRHTIWNKFDGRNDELKRLSIEADKAIQKTRTKETDAGTEESDFEELTPASDLGDLTRIDHLIANAPRPRWLVKDIWNVGACGIIAGPPKSFKSYIALDLAFSVATGRDFLELFKVNNPGPVALIQEEDAVPTLAKRIGELAEGKDPRYHPDGYMTLRDGKPAWGPSRPLEIYSIVRAGIHLDEPMYQEWLDDQLSKQEYRMCIIDPMGMAMGEVEENRYGELNTRFLTPLKQLAEKYKTAIVLVHHTRKTPHTGRRGAALLGSQAAYGWVEDWMYIDKASDRKPDLKIMRESKSAEVMWINLRPRLSAGAWHPDLSAGTSSTGEPLEDDGDDSSKEKSLSSTHQALIELGSGVHDVAVIIEAAGIQDASVRTQLARLKKRGIIHSPERGKYALVEGK